MKASPCTASRPDRLGNGTKTCMAGTSMPSDLIRGSGHDAWLIGWRPRLLQQIFDLVEAGLHAGLVVAARRARYAGGADHLVADLDRKRAGNGDDVRQR